MNKKQLQKCKDIFNEIDTNNSGGIDCFELLEAIRKFNPMISMDEIIMTFQEYDLNHNGEIDFDEFMIVIERFKNTNEHFESDETIELIFESLSNNDKPLKKIPLQIILDHLKTFELDIDNILEKIHNQYTQKNIQDFYQHGIDFIDFRKIFF